MCSHVDNYFAGSVAREAATKCTYLPKVDDVALAVALFVGVLDDVAIPAEKETVDCRVYGCQLEVLHAKDLQTKVMLRHPPIRTGNAVLQGLPTKKRLLRTKAG